MLKFGTQEEGISKLPGKSFDPAGAKGTGRSFAAGCGRPARSAMPALFKPFAIIFLLSAFVLVQADFVRGNLVLARVGDGQSSLTNAATAVVLEEIDTNGNLVSSLTLPVTENGGNHRHTNSGVATSELGLQRSGDNRYLVLMGYDAEPGTPAIAATRSAQVGRVVSLIAVDGAVDSRTALTDAYDGGNPRNAFSTDGGQIWTAGTAPNGNSATAGIRFCTRGSPSSVQIASAPLNTRAVLAYGSDLYLSSGASPFIGVSRIPGLPIGGGQTVTLLPGMPSTNISSSPYDFYFANPETLYVSNDVAFTGGIQRWAYSQSSGQWELQYVLNQNISFGVRRMVGSTDPFGVTTLYGISGEATQTEVYEVIDTGPGALFRVIAIAPENVAYRGISFAPEGNGGGPQDIYPASFSIFRGAFVSGSLAELFASDDRYVTVRNGPIALPSESPITVIFDGRYEGSTTSALSLSLENKVSIGNLNQRIDLFDFTANGYDALTLDSRSGSTSDAMVIITPLSIERFFGPGGALRARLRVRPAGVLFTNNWRTSVDQLKWSVVP